MTLDFMRKPEPVQAMQFKTWASFREMHLWCRNVYYVPQGYEHYMRRENEHDRSNGHILEDAPAYVVLIDSRGGNGDVRININDWVVREDGKFFAVSPLDFEAGYVPAVKVSLNTDVRV